MQWLKDLGSKRFPEIMVTAVGFLTALLINSAIERYTAWRTYRSTLASLRAEAKSNREVLDKSFKTFAEKGLIFRRFDIDVGSDTIRQVSMVSHATEDQTASVYQYLRDLRLANRYADELAAAAADTDRKRDWEPSLRTALSSHLASCAKSIDTVTNLSAD